MFSQRRRILSQNFLYSRKLVKQLVRSSSVGLNDLVLEIGPGKGIITEELLATCRKVIAVEIDSELYSYLSKKFYHLKHKCFLLNENFLKSKLPNENYKVFSNIPFSIEGKIVRKLLNAYNPPTDCYLVIRRDLAERLSGIKSEGQFSITYKPYFDFEVVHHFRKTDFAPMARMQTVLWRFRRKEKSLLLHEEMRDYQILVEHGFRGGKRLKYNLRSLLTHNQFQKLANKYKFNTKSKPSDLKVEQWIGLFRFLKSIKKI
jgi:23S rRNA (adenine-N6)-dimethyltransferase